MTSAGSSVLSKQVAIASGKVGEKLVVGGF